MAPQRMRGVARLRIGKRFWFTYKGLPERGSYGCGAATAIDVCKFRKLFRRTAFRGARPDRPWTTTRGCAVRVAGG
jgi:hypothetical protein